MTIDFFSGRGFAAFLFDMDGTLLTSVAAAERVWSRWAQRHGLDVAAFLPTIHGVQTVETIRRLGLPGVDPVSEAASITAAEMEDVADVRAIDGSADFLLSLPRDRWAIATSAPRALAERRLKAAGLPWPPMMVSAEDVVHGKPAPDCFNIAAQRLGRDARDCLVFEDAMAGIEAAEAAGSEVVVIAAAHRKRLETQHRTALDYRCLRVTNDPLRAGDLVLVERNGAEV